MKNISKDTMLKLAEIIDAFRLVPRALLIAYGYLLYYLIKWYTGLKPYVIDGCESTEIKDCITTDPTNQHAVLITTVVGLATAIFGLYASTGRKWNNSDKKDENKGD